MTTYTFTDAEFMTAKEKGVTYIQWERFLRFGFRKIDFTERLYKHLSLHCGFIAHFGRWGFYDTYFVRPERTQRFLDQFDRDKGCPSIEYSQYGIRSWGMPEYADLKVAMIDAAGVHMDGLRKRLRSLEIANAEADLILARHKLESLKG